MTWAVEDRVKEKHPVVIEHSTQRKTVELNKVLKRRQRHRYKL
jgi:hypothetical protein